MDPSDPSADMDDDEVKEEEDEAKEKVDILVGCNIVRGRNALERGGVRQKLLMQCRHSVIKEKDF